MAPPYILLAEDNPDDERLTLRALRRVAPNVHVHVVRDGQEAADLLLNDTHEPRPHLVLLDIQMPKLTGLEVLARLHQAEHCKSLPVVMLTSSDEESDIRFAYEHGANSYVQKPVDSEAFMSSVGRLGLYWLEVNIPPGERSER
jgi:two-component system, response regulator